MSEHKSQARASGSNPPYEMPAGLEYTECDGTPLSAMGILLDRVANLESRINDMERRLSFMERGRADLMLKLAEVFPSVSWPNIRQGFTDMSEIEDKLRRANDTRINAIMPGSYGMQVQPSLDRLVQLHERIEVVNNVDHYEVSLLTSERQAMVGIGGTIHEAMMMLTMLTASWTIDDVRTCGGKN